MLRGKKKCGGEKTEEMVGSEREKHQTDYASRKRVNRLGGNWGDSIKSQNHM